MQTTTTLNGKTSTVETMASSLNGVNGEYTIKIDANGVVAGIGLINGPAGSQFGVYASDFFIADPTAPNTQVLPFIVSGGAVYMNTAIIANAAIAAAQIASLNASQITTGTLAASTSLTVGGVTINAGTGTNNGNVCLGKSGPTDTTAGFWLGNNAGTPEFAIGNSTSYILWDGSILEVSANIDASSIKTGTLTVGSDLAPLSIGESNLKIIRGLVSTLGSIVYGSGFTCTRIGVGKCTITFTGNPFSLSQAPTVIVTCNGSSSAGAPGIAVVDSTGSNDVIVYCYVGSSLADYDFNFIAIGQ